MIAIKEALPNQFNIIQDIAYKTWPVTYGEIIPTNQLEYMLGHFYSIEALNKDIQSGHHFLIAFENEIPLGFASYVHDYPEPSYTKIPKIYILPQAQGKGVGRSLIQVIAEQAQKHGSKTITLNVNRFNKARYFYEKIGFAISREEDVPLDHGFLMEDFVMVKSI